MDLEIAYDKIYRYVYFKVNDRAVAEDITQETFLKYLSKKNAVHDYEMKFLYTIAKNLCIDEYRRIKPEALTEEHAETLAAKDDPFLERYAVREALSKLSEEDRELLLLRYVNDAQVGTIAGILNISRFAVYRKLKEAESRLKKELKEDDR